MLFRQHTLLIQRLVYFFSALLLIALPISKALSNLSEIVLVVLALIGIFQPEARQNWKVYRWVALPMLFFGVYLIGLVWTENFKYALKFLNNQHRLLAFPLIIITFADLYRSRHQQLLRYFIWGVLAASLVTLGLFALPEQTVIELTQRFGFLNSYPINDNRLIMGLYSPFIDRIQFSSMLAIAILSGIYLFRKKFKTIEIAIATLIMIVTTLLLGGRGGQLGLFAGITVYVLYLGLGILIPKLSVFIGRKAAIISICTLIISSLTVLPFVLYQTVPSIKERYGVMLKELEEFSKDKSNSGLYEHKTTVRRIVSWQNSWTIIQENWLIGVGTGDYLDAMKNAYDHDQYKVPVNSHSQYLQIWVSVGIIGLLAFMAIIAIWYYKVFDNNDTAVYSMAVMTFYLVSFIPDAVLLTQIDVMAFSFFYCFLGVLQSKSSEKVSDTLQ